MSAIVMFTVLAVVAVCLVFRPGPARAGENARDEQQGDLLQAANDAAMLLLSDDEDLEELARRALGAVGGATGADRADVWRNHGSSKDGLLCTKVFSWNSDEATNYSGTYTNTAAYAAHLPGWEEELAAGRSVNTSGRELSPQEHAHLESQFIGSAFAVPILYHNRFWGFIRLGLRAGHNSFGKAEERVLVSVGLLLATTMQRRQIREELAESEQRFRDVAGAAGEVVWELDSQGYVSYVSERVLELMGFHPHEVLGKRMEDFAWDDAGAELTGQMFQSGLETGSFRGIEHRMKSKNGRAVWMLSSGKLLTGPDGIAGLRGISLDVTRDRETTENLNSTLKALEVANRELESTADRAYDLARTAESASRAKSDFMANMSHEIRTPLNAIIGMTYLMQKTPLSPKQEEYTGIIHAAGQTLLGIVNNILDFSKIESGALAMEPQPFDLEPLFDELAQMIGARIEEKGLDAAFLIDADVPRRLVGDPLRLSQVLANITDNAVKFTDQGGINVRCSLEGIDNGRALLRILVKDTGIGIAQDQQHNLFQSFSQLDASITRKHGGTGLGLVLAKSMLELAGGTLSLESAPGKGTQVTLRIPLEIDADAAGKDRESPLLTQGLPVLLLEESGLQRLQLLEILRGLGCRVAAFSDMGQAFAALAGKDLSPLPFSIVMLPLGPALENNAENLRHIFETMHLEHPPRVLCTVPFGFAGLAEEGAGPAVARHIAGLVRRPLRSTQIYEALCLSLDPQAQCSPGQLEDGRGGGPVPYFPGKRVLLVEDNEINQQIALELLKETGISVTVADNGKRALELLENNPGLTFDMVFMDLQMPEMDGFAATRHLRSQPRFQKLPIIAMTAHATVEEREHSLAVGMDEHLAKPIVVTALYDALRRWLSAPAPSGTQTDAPSQDESPLSEELGKLNALLADDDAEACRIFAALKPRIAAVDGEAAARAEAALAVFDFAEALAALAPMENGLRSSAGEGG